MSQEKIKKLTERREMAAYMAKISTTLSGKIQYENEIAAIDNELIIIQSLEK
jgi:hypothetical protein